LGFISFQLVPLRRGKKRLGAAIGSFRLATVGINESARKYVAAVRRATRLYLSLCFAAGDLAPLVVGGTRHLSFLNFQNSTLSKSPHCLVYTILHQHFAATLAT
jgi:hypothetical protein